jgi:hypothetical protein
VTSAGEVGVLAPVICEKNFTGQKYWVWWKSICFYMVQSRK